MRYLLFFISAYFLSSSVYSQSTMQYQIIGERWLESLAESGFETVNNDDIEYLVELISDPININTVTKEELDRFFFLSDLQIENILYYLYENGSMLTAFELQGVKYMDKSTIELLVPLIKVEPKTTIHNKFRGYTLFRTQSLLETPRGYTKVDTLPSHYSGSKTKAQIRTGLSSRNFKLGIAAEKDPGEKWLNYKNATPDFLSGYIQYSSAKTIKKIIVGTYRTGFGQGLALSNSYPKSLLTDPVNIRIRPKRITGYNSTDEYNYLRGAAFDIKLATRINLSTFISIKSLDASFTADSQFVNSILKSGSHRSISEITKQNTIREEMIGAVISSSLKRIEIEAGYYHYNLNSKIVSNQALYKKDYYNGNSFNNVWFSYSTIINSTVFFGELAVHENNCLGLVQGAIWEPANAFSLSIKYHQFNRGYFAPYMSPGSINENPSGESMLSIGFKLLPIKKWTVSSYHLIYKNDWLKFQLNAPSKGMETMLQIENRISGAFSTYARLRHKQFQKNDVLENNQTIPIEKINQTNFRLQTNYNASPRWNFNTRIEHCTYSPENSKESNGWLFNQDFIYSTLNEKWKFQFRYSHFDTDDYRSRIYAYEPNVLLAYSVPSYSGRGHRAILNLRYKVHSKFQAYLRISQTYYSDRNEIGSGHDKISGSKKTDATLQLRYLLR